MSPLEHRSSCLAVVTLMVVAMILIGVMNGLTAHCTVGVLAAPDTKEQIFHCPEYYSS